MDINKAIKKQNKVLKNFVLFMCFIFFALPIIMVALNKVKLFYVLYLCILEILILIAIIGNVNKDYLKYECKNYKIILKKALFLDPIIIVAEKVVLVHTENSGSDMKVILLLTSKFRNKRIRSINKNFLFNHAYLSHHYYRLKKQHPEQYYFYLIINNGGYNKYKFLQDIYKTCVHAFFTDEAIERIKEIQV